MRLLFGDFAFDPDARDLLRGGQRVELSPKALELLRALLEARPRALSRNQLQDRLWPTTFVAESNLPSLIKEVRTALLSADVHFKAVVRRRDQRTSVLVDERTSGPTPRWCATTRCCCSARKRCR